MGKSFVLKCDFGPAGDQPEAIRGLTTGLQDGLAYQTLLGVTGSGKTGSMERALAEMARRQQAGRLQCFPRHYSARGPPRRWPSSSKSVTREPRRGRRDSVNEPECDYRTLAPEPALRKIKKLEERMFRHARDLEFEQAAQLRDEIGRIRAAVFGIPPQRAVASVSV